MNNIPFTSLFNIFYHPGRKLTHHDGAYKFIIDDKNQQNLFILLRSLDSKQMTISSTIDSLINCSKHFGYLPLLDFSFIDTFNQILSSLKIETNKNINQITEMLKEKLIEINKIKENNQQLIKNNKKINNLNQKNQQQLALLNQNVDQLKSENEKLNTKIQEKDENANKLLIEIAMLNQNIRDLQKESANKDEIIKNLNDEIDVLNQNNQELQTGLKIEENEIKNLQNANDELNQDNQKLKVKIKNLQDTNDKLCVNISELKTKNQNNDETILHLTNENDELKHKIQNESENKEKSNKDDLNLSFSDNMSILSNSSFIDLFDASSEIQLYGSNFEIEDIENLKKPKISKDDIITVMHFLRSYLYTKDYSIKRFYIENKSESQSNIGKLLKLIKKDYNKVDPNRVIKYYIYKEENDFKVKYLNDKDLINEIPNHLFIQIRPHQDSPYRIFIFINKTNLDLNNFDPNKDGIPFALQYYENMDAKKLIMSYLLYSAKKDYKNEIQNLDLQLTLYSFNGNYLSEINNDYYTAFANPKKPCFITFTATNSNEFIFDLFRSHITNKFILRPQ